MSPATTCFVAVLGACASTPAPVTAVENHAEPAVVPPSGLEISLERTRCLGACSAYRVTIHRDGAIDWDGKANVRVPGIAHAKVDRKILDELEVALDASRFFERDGRGKLPPPPCSSGPDTICVCKISTCSDTSYAIVTVTRGAKTHTVEDAHCDDVDLDLVLLERLVDRLADTERWIAR